MEPKYKPFQEVNVEVRLKEIFDGKVCYRCGAPATRLRPNSSTGLPVELTSENYFCFACFGRRRRGGRRLNEVAVENLSRIVEPITPWYDLPPDDEGAEPFLLVEPEIEREYIHREVDGCAYGEYFDELEAPNKDFRFNRWVDTKRERRNNAREYQKRKRDTRRVFLDDLTQRTESLPRGTGIYVQIGDEVFPWMTLHEF